MRATDRARYVPDGRRHAAYGDRPVPLSHGQTTSQPSLIARMVAEIVPTSTSVVLEVGTGLGYQTALLARLTARVVTIDVHADLSARAAANLATDGITNVDLRVGDGTLGAADVAPFDGIIVSAAFDRVYEAWIDQLALGGRLVVPIGPGGDEWIQVFSRTADGPQRLPALCRASFVTGRS